MVFSAAPPRPITKATPDEILAIADRLEPQLRDAFLSTLERLSNLVPLGELTDLLDFGNIEAVQRIVSELRIPTALIAETQQILTRALVEAGNAAGVGFGLSFTLTNPYAVRWAEQHTGELIVGIMKETRNAVTDIVARGVREGIDVRTQARSIKRIVGLTRRDADAVDRHLASLLEAGTSRKRADQLADRMRNRLLRRRAENIARTETMTAANTGQLHAWNEAADAGLLNVQTTRRVWIATGDDRICPTCSVLDGETVGFNEPFVSRVQATGVSIEPAGTLEGTPQQNIVVTGTKPLKTPVSTMTPPAHPSCRCTVGLEFDTTTRRLDFTGEPIPGEFQSAIDEGFQDVERLFGSILSDTNRVFVTEDITAVMNPGRPSILVNSRINDPDWIPKILNDWKLGGPLRSNIATYEASSSVDYLRRVARHEAGHLVRQTTLQRVGSDRFDEVMGALWRDVSTGGPFGGWELEEVTSLYGQENPSEWFAECVADVLTFGDDANPVSWRAVNALKGLLE